MQSKTITITKIKSIKYSSRTNIRSCEKLEIPTYAVNLNLLCMYILILCLLCYVFHLYGNNIMKIRQNLKTIDYFDYLLRD